MTAGGCLEGNGEPMRACGSTKVTKSGERPRSPDQSGESPSDPPPPTLIPGSLPLGVLPVKVMGLCPQTLTSPPAPCRPPTTAGTRALAGRAQTGEHSAAARVFACLTLGSPSLSSEELRRSVRKTLLILITHKQPTGTKDFGCLWSGCTVLLWKERSNQPPSLLL